MDSTERIILNWLRSVINAWMDEWVDTGLVRGMGEWLLDVYMGWMGARASSCWIGGGWGVRRVVARWMGRGANDWPSDGCVK